MLVSVTRVKVNFRFSTFNLRILLEPLRICILLGDTALYMRIYERHIAFFCMILKLLLVVMVAASQHLLRWMPKSWFHGTELVYYVVFSMS